MTIGDRILRRHEDERHARIVTETRWPWRTPPRQDDDGYMTIADAAKTMGTTHDEVIRLAHHGILDYRGSGQHARIRPAIITGFNLKTIA